MQLRIHRRWMILVLLLVGVCVGEIALLPAPVWADAPPEAQSRTGPTPPPEVLEHDRAKGPELPIYALEALLLAGALGQSGSKPMFSPWIWAVSPIQ